MSRYELDSRLVIEAVDESIMACDPTNAVVHRLDGDAAGIIRTLRSGTHDLTPSTALDELVAAGIVVPSNADPSPAAMSRRTMMRVGATAAAVGLVTVALPTAAAAASEGGGGEDGGGSLPAAPTFTPEYSFRTADGRIQVVWEPTPEPFTYNYSITVTSGSAGTGASSGTLSASTSPTPIYFVAAASSVSLTMTSNTSPQVTDTQTFTRP